ncbi:MAG: hypothetical protein V1652_01495 [bacterium]
MNVISWATSRWAHEIEEKFGEGLSFFCMVIFIALPIFLMGRIVATPVVLATLFHSVIRGYEKPFFDYFMHRNVGSEQRATVLSVQSAARQFAGSIGLWVFGIVLAATSLPVVLQIIGVMMGVGGIVFLVTFRRVF